MVVPEESQVSKVTADKNDHQDPQGMPTGTDLFRRELTNELLNRDKDCDQDSGTGCHSAADYKDVQALDSRSRSQKSRNDPPLK